MQCNWYWSRHERRVNLPTAVERGSDSWCLQYSNLRVWVMVVTGKTRRKRIYAEFAVCGAIVSGGIKSALACLSWQAPNAASSHTQSEITALSRISSSREDRESRAGVAIAAAQPRAPLCYLCTDRRFISTIRVWVESFSHSPCLRLLSALSPNALSLTLKFDGRIGWLRKQTQSADRTLYPLSTPPPASSRRVPLAADPPPLTEALYGGRRLFLVDVWRPLSQKQLMATDAGDFSSRNKGGRREIEN